jgi:diguanylate cyclase (GGDEF)-like protein
MFRFLRDIAPRRLILAVAVMAAGLSSTLLASFYIKQDVETAARNTFDSICNEIQTNISDRLASHALVLYSGSALFYASDDVTRSEWHVFTSNLRIEQQMPGTQGIGYSLLIPSDQLEQHIQKIRAEGFPDYTVQPEGKRDVYSSIIYLEPFTGRNLRAFGYDMFSEPVRRAVMERARDENIAALSRKVTLVQETEEDIQAGTLMYVPVYRKGMPITTVEERRAAIQGWVYSPYRMNDLMRGTLENHELKQGERYIIFQIYDGKVISDETLLYDSRSDEQAPPDYTSADLTKTVQVEFFGEPWTLQFTLLGGLPALADYGAFRMVMIGGTSISLLLFVLIISLMRTAHYLESIRLLAETDSLTSVYNRRKIIDLAESEFIRARRQRHPLTILMTDLNFFKQINDNYGHIAGDHALRITASAIQSTVRKNIDRVGRFGGDEFLIILPEISQAQLENIFDRLRANVAENTKDITSGIHEISLSIGSAELSESTRSIDELIERADQAMYADKRQWK